MKQTLRGSVVVITGASSGIGRGAALAFAGHGARLVLAARRAQPLDDLATQCQRLGAEALAVPTDVTDEVAVDDLARRASDRFGRLDVWVNNAGVYLAGRFEDVPVEAFRRVIDTNLLGYVYGARAALRRFRLQGRGVLINNASIAARVPMAYFSAYTASKFAVYGLSGALRQELRGTAIRVCVVLPSSIDTPIFQHVGNYGGRRVRAMSPVYEADSVARAIVGLARNPKDEIAVGSAGRLMATFHRVTPRLVERLVARLIERDHLEATPAPDTSGNLFDVMPEGADIDGGWKPRRGEHAGWRGAIGALLGAGPPQSGAR
jgi:NADP-dependent 3-hydroxy acid dehydrogenase YdfG